MVHRWRFAWAWLVGAVLVGSCGGGGGTQPPPKPPEPPVPEPQCQAGQAHSCWHRPPGSPWVYACPIYIEAGGISGVVNVTGGPSECPSTEEPSEPGCVLSGEPTTSISVPASDETRKRLGDVVNAAIQRVTGCSPGSVCLLGDVTQQEFQAHIEAEIRSVGVCAGQHSPGTDEIAVAEACPDAWHGFHIFAGDDSDGPVPPGSVRRTVVWYPGSYRDAWVSPRTCSNVPPEQPPTPEPPTPEPPPDSGTPPGQDPTVCSDPKPPPFDKCSVKIHNAFGYNLDGTCKVRGAEYCASVGFPNTTWCPTRPECPPSGILPDGTPCTWRDREACEKLIGPVVWTSDKPIEVSADNPYRARYASDATWVKLCAPPVNGREICGSLNLK